MRAIILHMYIHDLSYILMTCILPMFLSLINISFYLYYICKYNTDNSGYLYYISWILRNRTIQYFVHLVSEILFIITSLVGLIIHYEDDKFYIPIIIIMIILILLSFNFRLYCYYYHPLPREYNHLLQSRYADIESEYDQCSICVSEINSNETIVIYPCKHIFHILCIDQWIGRNSCPNCRQSVVRI
jgi:hypothetical protein